MKVYVHKAFGRIGSAQITHTYDVAFDEGAAPRALNMIQGLQRDNYFPKTVVAGLRAYLSLYAEKQEMTDKNQLSFAVHASSGENRDKPFTMFDVPVELDMNTQDDDEIRVTCGFDGIAERLEARPDVQVWPTLTALFTLLQERVMAGRRNNITRYEDKVALQLGFRDGPETHVVPIGALTSHYVSHHQASTLDLYQRDLGRILDSR